MASAKRAAFPTYPQAKPGGAARASKPTERIRSVARNRRARHDYEVIETIECGIALRGSEVKSLRAGRASLQDSYARVEEGELWLIGMHVPPYEHASGFGAHEPTRRRKLLAHRDQIDELAGKTGQKSLTLVPLSVYIKDGRAKVELALARGRRLWDKRQVIAARDAERDASREAARAMGRSTPRGSRREIE